MTDPSVENLRKASSAIYIAVDKVVADDISNLFKWAANEIERLSKPSWECMGLKQSLPEPGECDWPDCGCDPHATKVIESLLEQGWTAVTNEHKEAFRRLDEAIAAIGKASTETQISSRERWQAANVVRDYLFELRGRMQEAAGADVGTSKESLRDQ